MSHEEARDAEVDGEEIETPAIREQDRAASGAPRSGWAIGDRFGWEEVHQRLLASADEEIASGVRELLFSGFTAGFAIVLTLIGYAVGSALYPENAFAAALLYPIGFLYIILGRYQLYTENTLAPVQLVLTRLASLPLMLRLWGVVLFGNTVGALVGTSILAYAEVLSPEARVAAAATVEHGLELGWWGIFFRGLFAGWLVAGVVWISAAARDTISRLVIAYVVFYTIAACDLFHVVTTGAEISFVMLSDLSPDSPARAILHFWLPVLLGNTAGGVLVFTLTAYEQTEQRTFPEIRVLSVREVLFGMRGGRPFGPPRPKPPPLEDLEDEDA